MSARALLEDYYRIVWTEGRLDAIERFFAPEASAGGLTPPVPLRPEDLHVLAETVRSVIRRPRFTIHRMVEEGEWASALLSMEGTVVASGRQARCDGQLLFRHVGGRIVEAHNSFDLFGFFVEIGAVPQDALFRILAGETLA